MKATITMLLAAAATVVTAQDTVVATASCEPHGDHWHCPSGIPEPTAPPTASASSHHDDYNDDDDHSHSQDTVSATASGVCQPHGDHWHCPAGVAEPTAAPGTIAVTASPAANVSLSHDDDHDHIATASTCQPHGDHWHCPSGVPKPTTPPAASVSGASTLATGTQTAASSSSSSSSSAASQQTGNAAAAIAVGSAKNGILAALMGAVAYFL